METIDALVEEPVVGIVHSFNDTVPGNFYLRAIDKAVKDGVGAAGGASVELSTGRFYSRLAIREESTQYSLGSCEIMADSIEHIVKAQPVNALVFIPHCDKTVAGMLMAAARLNLPTVFLSGGPMLTVDRTYLGAVLEAARHNNAVRTEEATPRSIEESVRVCCGSCMGMNAANSMISLSEALGMAFPVNETILTVFADRIRNAKDAGMCAVELLRAGIRPSHIMTERAFLNALIVDMALGFSSRTVLHLFAIARECGITINSNSINELSGKMPGLNRLAPVIGRHEQEFLFAGGISAVMHELHELLYGDEITVTGKTIGEIAKPDPGFIRKPAPDLIRRQTRVEGADTDTEAEAELEPEPEAYEEEPAYDEPMQAGAGDYGMRGSRRPSAGRKAKTGYIVRVDDVSMKYLIAREKVESLKEYFIRALKRQIYYDELWALINVTFDVKRGEILGIMGLNGAGKSTLLKVISGVLQPTLGSVKVTGSVAPLLELEAAGFDGDLTGEENIYMNGASLGYSSAYMNRYRDEIIEFAELGDFANVPVKNYSSGMRARLGFSIATMVRPDLLIADEVLGVGDVNFFDKCMQRVKDMVKDGTSIILVSHSIGQVRSTCDRALLLDKGRMVQYGKVAR